MGGGTGPGVIQRLVETAWSANVASTDPDDPRVRGFAEFGLAPDSGLARERDLRELEAWRERLRIPANSAFLDTTLLWTVLGLLSNEGPLVLTPVTLWELTAFIDALVCFDQLYCLASQTRRSEWAWGPSATLNLSDINELLGEDVLTVFPVELDGGLRPVVWEAAHNGRVQMGSLRAQAGHDNAFGQEVQTVVDGWRAVLGPDLPSDGLFDIDYLLEKLPGLYPEQDWATPHQEGAVGMDETVRATRLPRTPADTNFRPALADRQLLALTSTFRTYVDQGIANALALPYLPGTLRMPFRRLFVERAAEVQDELVSIALADRAFARQQPSSPLILPFFTAAVLQGATTREDVWAQMARVRNQSTAFRNVRADLDRMLERSQVSPQALRVQRAIRDEALKLADLAGATQQAASVALGVVAQTGAVPLAGALKVGVDAARGVDSSGSWTRIWRRLFHRHEYFLAQTNSQAIALTNALPQIQQLWEMPKIGGYLERFASATQQLGHVLRD
jgi:hypothetical protein